MLTIAPSPDLEKCIEEKCPNEYSKCKATRGCEDKLNKCEARCGAKYDQACWTLCLGIPGAAANVCICSVNKGCIPKVSELDRIGLTLMQVVNNVKTQ